MGRDTGLDTLLDLDGSIIDQGDGYWVSISAKRLEFPTAERPHRVSYSLSLHDPNNQRILGFDNAHAVKEGRANRYSGRRVEYDHKHRALRDKGVVYEFISPYQLLKDFFSEVDRILKEH